MMEVNPTALSVSTRLFLSWVETFFALLFKAGKKEVSVGGLFRAGKEEKGGEEDGCTWLRG